MFVALALDVASSKELRLSGCTWGISDLLLLQSSKEYVLQWTRRSKYSTDNDKRFWGMLKDHCAGWFHVGTEVPVEHQTHEGFAKSYLLEHAGQFKSILGMTKAEFSRKWP